MCVHRLKMVWCVQIVSVWTAQCACVCGLKCVLCCVCPMRSEQCVHVCVFGQKIVLCCVCVVYGWCVCVD